MFPAAFLLLMPVGLSAQDAPDQQETQETEEQQQPIEHLGDRYIIHVDALHPDSEMTLMDVLQSCPELISNNGKQFTQTYELRIDNIPLTMDEETLLHALRAADISTIQVCVYTSVTKGGDGSGAIIDVYLKPQAQGVVKGYLQLEGSTRGNGMAYGNIVGRTGDVTLRGYALGNLHYSAGTLTDIPRYSSRLGIDNMHLSVDWDISQRDNIKFKLHQDYLDSKQRLYHPDEAPGVTSNIQRDWYAVASYLRTLNSAGATLNLETGIDYLNAGLTDARQRDCMLYYFTEANIPCLNNALNIMAGWEIDYLNTWNVGAERQQMMFNDLYALFDFSLGRLKFAVGDRLRIINYWQRDSDSPLSALWRNRRTENSYLLSAGYRMGAHFLQVVYNHDYDVPLIDDFEEDYDIEQNRRIFNANLPTNVVRRAELRYTWQQPSVVLWGSVLHTWSGAGAIIDERHTGARASLTWHCGALRLTAGADYYHESVIADGTEERRHFNYFNLRLLPTLTLGHGLRISARLFYNSRMDLLSEVHPHLYASVKVSKRLGRHVTLTADFHDLAGNPTMSSLQMPGSFDNRALTLGVSCRF